MLLQIVVGAATMDTACAPVQNRAWLLSYLPDYYLKGDLAQGKLIKVMNDWQSADHKLVAIYQHRRHVSLKIRLFSEFVRETFSKKLPLMLA